MKGKVFMEGKSSSINPQNTEPIRYPRLVLGTTFILLIPYIAMQFTEEVDWRLPDFIIIGTLLFGTGFIYEAFVKRVMNPANRAALTLALLFTLFLIWAELAVGVFGTPFAGS